jgi:hypothetical protein
MKKRILRASRLLAIILSSPGPTTTNKKRKTGKLFSFVVFNFLPLPMKNNLSPLLFYGNFNAFCLQNPQLLVLLAFIAFRGHSV